MDSDQTIKLEITLDAPVDKVWRAWTTRDGIKSFFAPDCDIDLRVGGQFRYVWRNPAGWEMGMGGTFLEVSPPKRVVTSEKFDQAWYEGSCVGTVEFEEKNGVTTMTMTLRYDSKEVRDGVLKTPMAKGLEMGFVEMAKLLDTLAR